MEVPTDVIAYTNLIRGVGVGGVIGIVIVIEV